MNEWYEQAKRKLETEKDSGSYDRYASAMKELICEKLCIFCKQDSEFAQAVVQGGAFADCMKAVAKGCGSALSDEEAIRRAVRFYFPGAGVKFHMELNLCADVEAETAAAAPVASTSPKQWKKGTTTQSLSFSVNLMQSPMPLPLLRML